MQAIVSNAKLAMSIVILALFVLVIGGCEGKQQSESVSEMPPNKENAEAVETITPEDAGNRPDQAVNKPGPAAQNQDPAADKLLALSTEEKIGQLVIIGLQGEKINADTSKRILADRVGGFILYSPNLRTVQQSAELINSLKALNQTNPFPLWISVDEEGGRVSRLPEPIHKLPGSREIGAADNPEWAGQIGTMIGRQLDAFGFNMNFAPVLDVDSNPDNPVIGERSYGSTADVVSRMGIAAMKGLQKEGVVAVVKHFPGHGDTSVDSHIGLPVVEHDMERLRSLELIPFMDAIRQGADAVMVAHLLMPAIDPERPASMSSAVINELLRGELGYDGVVITDDMTMGAITSGYDIGEAAVQSILAGCDIVIVGHDPAHQAHVITSLKEAVASGVITESMLDERVGRVVALKEKYRLNHEAVTIPDTASLNRMIEEALESQERAE
ncbi:beta-N-acetylhexosaminidase [Paenibacillus abyssi]|uniref:Glycoside hydrolase family 3 n=1 Tax=Paenibacillus abyssi TaxID=1340531 RepID=A0A917D110_9BACL|nr:beta-N-acetylhexosaminidase [Paenibacillus abyssi]GGG06798.1 glycoside hydrolase family 3 [Paenibacillus abyssi]